MYKLYYFRKDNPKIRKFDGRYDDPVVLTKRIAALRGKKYISDNWEILVKGERA